MSFSTEWFIAEETDAGAIMSIVMTEDHEFGDWPNLSLKDVGEMDLRALWGILRGEPENFDSATVTLLFQESDEGPFVCRVAPAFITSLAGVKETGITQVASEWIKADGLSGWDLSDVEQVLRGLVRFAMRATEERKPVLQLSVV
jgi:hypothetical protein